VQARAELSDPFCQALARALKKRTRDRFQSASEFEAVLRKSVGLRGDPLYNVFISYQAASDKVQARMIYDALHGSMTSGGIPVTVYLDQRRLSDGEDWEICWAEGLLNSRVFVPIISTAAVSSFAELRGDESDPQNNFLTETMIALALKERYDNTSVGSISVGGSTHPGRATAEKHPSTVSATTSELISDSSEASATENSASTSFGSHIREILPVYVDRRDSTEKRKLGFRAFIEAHTTRRLRFADKPSKISIQTAVDFLAGRNLLLSDGVRCRDYLEHLTIKQCLASLQSFEGINAVQRGRRKGTVLHPSQESICSDFLAAHSRKSLEFLKSDMECVAKKILVMIDSYARGHSESGTVVCAPTRIVSRSCN